MDPHPSNFPILSYVMSRLPSFGARAPPSPSSAAAHSQIDIEQPKPSDHHVDIEGKMPQLLDPAVLASMTRAISEVAQARSVLKLIGHRPTHEEIDNAKAKLLDIEAHLSRQLEEIVSLPRPPETPPDIWRDHIAQRERKCKDDAETERRVYKSLIQLDEMHDEYEKLLKDAEKRLVKIYDRGGKYDDDNGSSAGEEVSEKVKGILEDAKLKGVERVDISNQRLRLLPEAFGRIHALLVFHASGNQLTAIPDAITGLQNLEELNLSSNQLGSLPESIGMLQKLKFLNVSGNKLSELPDSLSQCRSLVELDVSFNTLTYLPTNIGYELQNLEKLSIQLNKIRSLPSSVCEMKSLRYLDAHFNELHGLPAAIGRLTNLEFLNLSSNFSDLKELPESFGDLISLQELDLSNNQIHALPDTFGRLDYLTKLNLEQNPLEVPPPEIVSKGVEAIKDYMGKRFVQLLAEEERKRTQEMQEQGQNGWLTRSTTWLKTVSDNVSDILETAVMSPKSPKEAYLNQQL